MNLGKKISGLWNKLICFIFGHTLTTVCTRCGEFVDLESSERISVEERINNWWKNRNLKPDKEFKGSLKYIHGLTKYAINLKTNELSKLKFSFEYEKDKDGNDTDKVVKRNAVYDPFCVYIDAMNDEVAIRKANNYLRGVKRGVIITYVSDNK